jgi:two-component system chemotaxis response regulator CheB
VIAPRKIRVLIVDDSALVRRLAREALEIDPAITVVGTATDPYEARDRLAALAPDVITLDLEMPRMDGLTFLTLLMEQRPTPVVVMSSLTGRGSEFAFEALRLGAVEVVGKPQGTYSFGSVGPELIAKVKTAARARMLGGRRPSGALVQTRGTANAPGRVPPVWNPRSLILLGASTGGVEALSRIMADLPGDLPGIAIVQHLPALFSGGFAKRLNLLSAVEVKEAQDGDVLYPGTALLAPGGRHLLLRWSGTHYIARLSDGPPLWHQRPAVDLLFRSAADSGVGAHCLAGVLTGMGRDGADGLKRLRETGSRTFAQDEASSVVYGMPRAARENGGAEAEFPLGAVAGHLARFA